MAKYIYKNISSDACLADFLLFGALILLYILYIHPRKFQHRKPNPSFLQTLEVLFHVHIRRRFPKQSPELFSCLLNGVKAALRDEYTRRPALILLMHTVEGKATAECLATRLIRVCLASQGKHKQAEFVKQCMTLEGKNYINYSDFWDFYSDLRDNMELHKMLIIKNFQDIHPHAVTLVCSFAHEMFTPNNQALLVILLEMSRYESGLTECTTRLAEICMQHHFIHSLDEHSWEDLLKATCYRPAIVNQELELPPE